MGVGAGLTGKGQECTFWNNGNVLYFDNYFDRQVQAFVRTYQMKYLRFTYLVYINFAPKPIKNYK